MATWEPKLQPPHPSTVSDLSEDAQTILAALERKWESSNFRNQRALTGPLAARTAAANRPVHTPNYYQQMYATKFGRPVPPPVPVSSLSYGTQTANVSGLSTLTSQHGIGQGFGDVVSSPAYYAASQTALSQNVFGSGSLVPPRPLWQSHTPNSPVSMWLQTSQQASATSQVVPNIAWQSQCNTPLNVSQRLDSHNVSQYNQNTQASTAGARYSPLMDFGSDDEGKDLIQSLTQPQISPFFSQPSLEKCAPNTESEPMITIDLSQIEDSQHNTTSSQNKIDKMIPMTTIDITQIENSESELSFTPKSVVSPELSLKDNDRVFEASLVAVTPSESMKAQVLASATPICSGLHTASPPSTPDLCKHSTADKQTTFHCTTPETSIQSSFDQKSKHMDKPSILAAKPSFSRSVTSAKHKQSHCSGNLSEAKAKLIESVLKTNSTDICTPVDNKSIREMFMTKKKQVDKEKQQQGETSKPEIVRKKKKFQTPFKSQVSQQETSINSNKDDIKITNLSSCDEIEKLDHKLQRKAPIEICITILYKEGFCQLSKSTEEVKKGDCSSPRGLMLAVLGESEPVAFYFLNLSGAAQGPNFTSQRLLVHNLLVAPCRRVCFKTQELFVYLIHVFGFKYHEVCLKWVVIDPLIGCWLINPDSPPSDFSQAMQILGLNRKKEPLLTPQLRACKNLLLLSQAAETMYQQLVDRGLWRVFLDLESRIVSILAVMEMRGMLVDKNCLKDIGNALESRLKVLQSQANKVVGAPVLLTSPQQLRRILYDQLKLDAKLNVPLTMQGGGKSTSEPVLKLLEPLHPLPRIILEFRHLQKIKSTYIDGIITFVNRGQLYTTWEQTSAATGRITSRDPNVQAIPKQSVSLYSGDDQPKTELWLRSAFQTKEGHSLLAADFQHVELRLFAHFAQDTALTAMFAQKEEDVFELLARQWLGRSSSREVSFEDRERTKRVVYSVMYGAGIGKLEQVLQVNNTEARRILSTFTAKFPKIRNFSQRLVRRARDQGYITSLSGRRRLFPNISSADQKLRMQSERQAVNFLIQGSAADVCKAAMIATEQAQQTHSPEPLEAQLLLQIHDELVWEVPDQQLDQFKNLVQKAMEGTRDQYKISIPLPVALGSGKTWADLK